MAERTTPGNGSMLAITQVQYRRVWNLGNYQSATIEATAAVNAGDQPDDVCTALRAWVDEQGPQKDDYGVWRYPARSSGGVAMRGAQQGEPGAR